MHRFVFPLVAALLLATITVIATVQAQDPKTPPKPAPDYSAELPQVPPKEPAEALKTFKLHPGFRMELVACEPLIRSPVALDFDENGRMYVVEYPEYNQYATKESMGHGRVRLLEDTDGDGRFDKATTFLDNVEYTVAVACYDGGVFVGAVPNILYCKDTDGDGKADLIQPIFTGFGRDPAGEGMMNSFRWGLDNRFHVSTSGSGGNVRKADDKDAKPVSVRRQDLIFDPRGRTFEATSGGGQHGMTMDDWGNRFVCLNSDPTHEIMYDGRYLARNPYVQAPPAAVNIAPGGKFTKLFRISPNEPWRVLRTRLRSQGIVKGSDEGGRPSGFFTGATGITVYRGHAWPEEYRGNIFIGEVSGNLVFRARLEQKGVGFSAPRADPNVEFLASTDNWFRPVQFANAPDGTLYVIDMYRGLIEGAAFLPPEILKHIDAGAGVDRGRIYRIVPEGFQQPKPPRLGQATTAELVALLEHPNGWHRDTASRLLYERQDRAAVPSLKKLAAASHASLGRMHALHALEGLNSLDSAQVLHALSDGDAHVREHAVRLAERFESVPAVRAKLEPLTDDPDARVRYQLAFSLGAVQGIMPSRALARLAVRDGADAWVRVAILSSVSNDAGDVFRLLIGDPAFRRTSHGRTLLMALATTIGAAGQAADVAAVVKALDELSDGERSLAQDVVRQLVSKQSAAARDRLKGGKAASILAELLRNARKTAADVHASPTARAAGLRTLGLEPFIEVRELFAAALGLRQPRPVQLAALETLVRFDDPAVPDLLLTAWPGLSPQLRATAIETLFARPAWLTAFLDAVEQGKVKPSDLDPARIALLQASADKQVRARAAKLFAGTRLSKRQDVVASYQRALQLKGDPVQGKAIFKKECSACHRLEGVGEQVGEDLAAIRDRGLDAVLLNILDPNREVKPQFLSYYLVIDTGRSITGLITAETGNSITLRRLDGTSETVLRVNVEEMRSTGMSFMPEGLEKQIDTQGMADLLAYLNSIK